MNTARASTAANAPSISTTHACRAWPRRIGKRETNQNSATVSGTQPHIPTRLVRSTSGQW